MPLEEESLRLLRRYRRLLFRRFRLLGTGDLEGALALEAPIREIEQSLRLLSDRWPDPREKSREFQPDDRRRVISRLVNQCAALTDRTMPVLQGLRTRVGGELFREKADLEIKKFLQKMTETEP